MPNSPTIYEAVFIKQLQQL